MRCLGERRSLFVTFPAVLALSYRLLWHHTMASLNGDVKGFLPALELNNLNLGDIQSALRNGLISSETLVKVSETATSRVIL